MVIIEKIPSHISFHSSLERKHSNINDAAEPVATGKSSSIFFTVVESASFKNDARVTHFSSTWLDTRKICCLSLIEYIMSPSGES